MSAAEWVGLGFAVVILVALLVSLLGAQGDR